MKRRSLLKNLLLAVSLVVPLNEAFGARTEDSPKQRPNVVLVLTDDQGYGDVGFNGNPIVKTPVVDQFAARGVRLDHFYANPVCMPTRAALLTGRYYQRTGQAAYYNLMAPDEYTLPEALRDSGYATAMFGKWHLGDNYPMRPQDQGFQQTLTFTGGMIGDFFSPIQANSYYDPLLLRDGKETQYQGYCTNIFVDQAIQFIEASARAKQPFFAYVALNAPHHPLTAPERYAQAYIEQGLSVETARYYGMITNVDDNFGRLLSKLDSLGISDDTIVIFMGDNGTSSLHKQKDLWECGLRGRKGDVHENGIRVPFCMRWPREIKGGQVLQFQAAAIDIMPTLLQACGAKGLAHAPFDGQSLLGVLRNGEAWGKRELFFHWGNDPLVNFAVLNERYKLVRSGAAGIRRPAATRTSTKPVGQPKEDAPCELFEISNDPGERHDLAAEHPEIVQAMKERYLHWYQEVSAARRDQIQRIAIGSDQENPVQLTRESWRAAGMQDFECGYWEVDIQRGGRYRVVCRLTDLLHERHEATLRVGQQTFQKSMLYHEGRCVFESIPLATEKTQIQAYVEIDGKQCGFRYISIERLE